MVNDIDLSRRVFSCIDNTTLHATDTDTTVEAFCRHTLELQGEAYGPVAAVCVYPRFVAAAKRVLAGSDIRVASVAGAKGSHRGAEPPFGFPVRAKLMRVLSRGLMLEGDVDGVVREVKAMKQACQGRTLKVILETCELPSPALIAQASQLAIDGGADFIKTSTGKGSAGATLEAAETMLRVIDENVKKTSKKVGFKAAGGISEPAEAIAYAQLAKKILGDDYIKNQTFRIGASRLTDCLVAFLT